jgi:hypothetical protein
MTKDYWERDANGNVKTLKYARGRGPGRQRAVAALPASGTGQSACLHDIEDGRRGRRAVEGQELEAGPVVLHAARNIVVILVGHRKPLHVVGFVRWTLVVEQPVGVVFIGEQLGA